MWTEKCKIDATINDVYIFFWNTGFDPMDLLWNTEANFLYMTKAIIQAAIVWWDGVPDSFEHDFEQWHALSR